MVLCSSLCGGLSFLFKSHTRLAKEGIKGLLESRFCYLFLLKHCLAVNFQMEQGIKYITTNIGLVEKYENC